MILGQSLLGEKFVWWLVGGVEGNFSVSFGPKPEFRLGIWTWTKLYNYMLEIVWYCTLPLNATIKVRQTFLRQES